MSFKDKVVIVSGASYGIGAETAYKFTQEGAKVVIVARNESKLREVAGRCAAVGYGPLVIKADVSVDEDARRVVHETIKQFGKLDVLVNNAAVTLFGTILNGEALKLYDETMNINLRAVVHLTQLAAPHLVQTKGNIVNTSSVTSQLHMMPAIAIYNISKAGVDHWTRGSALELAPFGVRVNAVSPGLVNTAPLDDELMKEINKSVEHTPLQRMSEPEEIADVILFLASDKAKGVTGSNYHVDNGSLLKGAPQ